MTQCGTCVARLYKSVIEEVIAGVKESFLDEGIDDQVLTDLKQQWEGKLNATKAAEHTEITQLHQQSQQQQHATSNQQQTTQQTQQTTTVQAMALVPIQITIPSQQAGGVAKSITIHAPSSALTSGIAGPQLQSILSSPAAAQTFALETSQAAEIIQRQLNAALQSNGVVLPAQLLQYNNPVSTQVDGPTDAPLQGDAQKESSFGPLCSKSWSHPGTSELTLMAAASTQTMDQILHQALRTSKKKGGAGLPRCSQMDGACGLGDSSDEISDDDDDDDDEEDEKEDDDRKGKKDDEDEDDDVDDETWNDDPLNSDDDVSDNEATDVFETENVVVCQYDKITRVRNKWKFHLKDGIMNLKSKDYVFTKANGEGEW